MRMNEEIVKTEFKKQAKDFSNKLLTMNSEIYLRWILQSHKLNHTMEVLDVAAGTGILSRALAPFVKKVTSMDISEDMILEGIHQNQLLNISNIEYYRGNVEKLPFDNATFELVVSRFAFHHLVHPNIVINEMFRVSNKTVSIIDMISSENNEEYYLYNLHERLRDPSHTSALKETEFLQLFKQTGLEVTHSELIEVDVNLQLWLDLTKTNQDVANKIISSVNNELETGKLLTGLDPFLKEIELFFKQKWIQIIRKK
jgi:ubiquinone/menaquinone biosynthesis C-methylase UbiE